MNKNKKIGMIIAIVVLLIILISYIGYIIYTKINNEKENNKPEEIFQSYIEYLNNENYSEVYNYLARESKNIISEEDFIKQYQDFHEELSISSIEVQDVKFEKVDNNNSRVIYTNKYNTIYGDINFQNTINLVKQEDKKYYINWDYNILYPNFSKDDKIDIDRTLAKRGSIIDRNGKLLAGSGYVANIGLVPGWMNSETKTQDIAKVAELLNMSVDKVNKKLTASYVKDNTFVELATISKEKLTVLNSLNEIDGVKIKDVASRVYPFGKKAAHLTGYVQKANAQDLENNKEYDENTLIGRTGLEYVYENRLKGKNGYEITLKDKDGKVKKTMLKTEKVDGENIKITVDSDVQTNVYDLYSQDNSATVVMNSKTGEIVALVSTPSFDPNSFVLGMTTQEWNDLNNNSNNPLYARYLKAYAPGSSFKPIIGALALKTGAISTDTVYDTSGTSWQKDASWGNYYITTLKQYSEPANLLNALINSDNIFFAKTALKIGTEALEEQLKNLGFETDFSFEMNLTKSQISNDGKFKNDVQLADSGYGQGQIMINPVHYAAIYSIFANDGNMVQPYIEYKDVSNNTYLKEGVISKEIADVIKNDMIQTIENPNGTANGAKISGVTLAGKTGTAETKTSKGEDAKEYGWFNAFNVEESGSTQYMVVSMVENVENKGGSSYVVKLVKSIFENIL